MPANIEIKATAEDLQALRAVARELADGPGETLHQLDVFFQVERGRLKLRIFSDEAGELIHYHRADTAGARRSSYRIYPTRRPGELRALLAAALEEGLSVEKKREVYLAGQTRIHLDEVAGLGSFVELEYVLRENQPAEEGRRVVAELMTRLQIDESDLVPCAYADLLAARA